MCFNILLHRLTDFSITRERRCIFQVGGERGAEQGGDVPQGAEAEQAPKGPDDAAQAQGGERMGKARDALQRVQQLQDRPLAPNAAGELERPITPEDAKTVIALLKDPLLQTIQGFAKRERDKVMLAKLWLGMNGYAVIDTGIVNPEGLKVHEIQRKEGFSQIVDFFAFIVVGWQLFKRWLTDLGAETQEERTLAQLQGDALQMQGVINRGEAVKTGQLFPINLTVNEARGMSCRVLFRNENNPALKKFIEDFLAAHNNQLPQGVTLVKNGLVFEDTNPKVVHFALELINEREWGGGTAREQPPVVEGERKEAEEHVAKLNEILAKAQQRLKEHIRFPFILRLLQGAQYEAIEKDGQTIIHVSFDKDAMGAIVEQCEKDGGTNVERGPESITITRLEQGLSITFQKVQGRYTIALDELKKFSLEAQQQAEEQLQEGKQEEVDRQNKHPPRAADERGQQQPSVSPAPKEKHAEPRPEPKIWKELDPLMEGDFSRLRDRLNRALDYQTFLLKRGFMDKMFGGDPKEEYEPTNTHPASIQKDAEGKFVIVIQVGMLDGKIGALDALASLAPNVDPMNNTRYSEGFSDFLSVVKKIEELEGALQIDSSTAALLERKAEEKIKASSPKIPEELLKPWEQPPEGTPLRDLSPKRQQLEKLISDIDTELAKHYPNPANREKLAQARQRNLEALAHLNERFPKFTWEEPASNATLKDLDTTWRKWEDGRTKFQNEYMRPERGGLEDTRRWHQEALQHASDAKEREEILARDAPGIQLQEELVRSLEMVEKNMQESMRQLEQRIADVRSGKVTPATTESAEQQENIIRPSKSRTPEEQKGSIPEEEKQFSGKTYEWEWRGQEKQITHRIFKEPPAGATFEQLAESERKLGGIRQDFRENMNQVGNGLEVFRYLVHPFEGRDAGQAYLSEKQIEQVIPQVRAQLRAMGRTAEQMLRSQEKEYALLKETLRSIDEASERLGRRILVAEERRKEKEKE